MQKIEFKNLPDETTPINSENLNTMQDNIEQYINLKDSDISKKINGEESMGSIVVENIKSKNLFDKNKVLFNAELVAATGATKSNSKYFVSDFIDVKGLSNVYLSSTNKTAGSLNCFYDENKQFIKNIPAITGKIPVPENSVYMRFNCLISEIDNDIQVEAGTIRTNYNKHINFECLKNKNYYDYSTASNTDNSAKIYCKLFEINVTKLYQTIYVNFDVIESENAGMLFNGKILLHNNYLGQIATNLLYGDYKLNAINGKIILYLEKNDKQNVKLSVYVYNTNNWRTFITKINSSFDSENDENSINITNNNLWQSAEPSNISKIEV